MEINGEQVSEVLRYEQLNLSPQVMRAIEKRGFVEATPVQSGAIPYFMQWRDVIAKAPTHGGACRPRGGNGPGAGPGPHPGAGSSDSSGASGPVRV